MNAWQFIATQYKPLDQFYPIHKFGRNTDVDSAGNEDVIEIGGLAVFDTGGTTIEAVSSDAGDTMSIWAEGVDASYNWIREQITLTGTDAVEFTTQFYHVFRARVVGNTAPTGQITIRKQTGPSTRIIIGSGYGGTLHGAFTIPTGYVGHLLSWAQSASKSATNNIDMTIELLSRPSTGTWVEESTIEFRTESVASKFDFDCPPKLVGPVDLRAYVETMSANDVRVSASFNVLLEKLATTDRSPAGPTLVGF